LQPVAGKNNNTNFGVRDGGFSEVLDPDYWVGAGGPFSRDNYLLIIVQNNVDTPRLI
jgi:hypothetical protein